MVADFEQQRQAKLEQFDRLAADNHPLLRSPEDPTRCLRAREKVAELMRDGGGERMSDQDVIARIVRLGESFQIMTHHTSFVAVERERVTAGGEPRLVRVPIEFPKGMSWEGIFGEQVEDEQIIRRLRQGGAVSAPHDGFENEVDAEFPSAPRTEAPGRLQQAPGETRGASGGRGGGGLFGDDQSRPVARERALPPRRSEVRLRLENQAQAELHFESESADADDGYAYRTSLTVPIAVLPHGEAVLAVTLHDADHARTATRLESLLSEEVDQGDAEPLARVVRDEEAGQLVLIAPVPVADIVAPFAERLADVDLADEQRDAVLNEMLETLARELPAVRRSIELRRRLDDSLHDSLLAFREAKRMARRPWRSSSCWRPWSLQPSKAS